MTVWIADDHFAIREGLKSLVDNAPGQRFQVVGTSASLAETRKGLAGLIPDILLLDLEFPDGTGLELLREVRDLYPRLAILIVSMHSKGNFLLEALRAGADGFVSKDGAGSTLLEALETVAAHNIYLGSEQLNSLAFVLRRTPANWSDREAVLSPLSDREREVFYALIHGNNSKTIATELGLSSKTVDNYRAQVLTKLGVETVVELVHFARRNNLF